MKIVYFPARLYEMWWEEKGVLHKYPSLHWGTVEDDALKEFDAFVRFWVFNPFTLFDGQPIELFEGDDKWKPYPKDISILEDHRLYAHRVTDDPKKEECDLALKEGRLRISDPDSLMLGIEKGWLVRSEVCRSEIAVETRKKGKGFEYRVIKKTPSYYNQLHWQKELNSRRTPTRDLYLNYDDALFAAKQKCEDWEERMVNEYMIDRAESIRFIMAHIPESQKDACRYVVENLHYGPGSMLRVFEGAVLYRRRYDDPWEEVYVFDEERKPTHGTGVCVPDGKKSFCGNEYLAKL